MNKVRVTGTIMMTDGQRQIEVDEYGEVGEDGVARPALIPRKRRLFAANGDTVADRGNGRYEVIQTGAILRRCGQNPRY